MKPTKLFLLAASIFTVSMSACHKDKTEETNTNIVKKTGLPMSGDQEVPVKTTGASGTMDVSYDKSTHILTFTMNWQNLTGTPTGSHIHGTAARGTNASIKFDFFSALPKTTSGTYSSTVTVDGTAIKEDSLLKGFYYMNIHTPTNPGGEIRGQIEF